MRKRNVKIMSMAENFNVLNSKIIIFEIVSNQSVKMINMYNNYTDECHFRVFSIVAHPRTTPETIDSTIIYDEHFLIKKAD